MHSIYYINLYINVYTYIHNAFKETYILFIHKYINAYACPVI